MVPADARVLILLNPGRQSRQYLLGLAAGADRAGIPCLRLELGPIWQRATGVEGAAVLASVRAQVGVLARKYGITHVIGYVYNGTLDLGLGSGNPPPTLWDELGVHHILLWTDHPEWAAKGAAIDPRCRDLLAGPGRTHLVKSQSAADEAHAVLGWPNIHALPMAEDYAALAAPTDDPPVHDAVAIVGDAAPPPRASLQFLDHDDPDPAAIDAQLRPHAELAWRRAVGTDHDALLDAWLNAKAHDPQTSFWRLAADLGPAHGASLSWLRADPCRYYTAVQAMRRMVGWRRNFWLAWLGRRADLGLYGSSAASMGIPQAQGADAWVPYADQARVYARGHAALNINAAHDEEGLTHKPFQIAGSATPCIHHSVPTLGDYFQPKREVLTFQRGPELLDLVRSAPARRELGQAMRARAIRDHTWESRLVAMFRLAASPAAAAA
jgi:hypothetical protein